MRVQPGTTRTVQVPFAVERLAVWDDTVRIDGAPEDWLHEGALRAQPGEYRIAAGGSADRLPVEAALVVTD